MGPNDLFNLIKMSRNPQQMMLNYLQQMAGSNPISQNLLQLAQNGNASEIEKIARNLAQSRGIDYDKEFNAFKQMFMR